MSCASLSTRSARPGTWPATLRRLLEHLPFFGAQTEKASVQKASPIARAMMSPPRVGTTAEHLTPADHDSACTDSAFVIQSVQRRSYKLGKSYMIAGHCRTLANDRATLLNAVGIAFWSSERTNRR